MSEDASGTGETLQNIGTILSCFSNEDKKLVRRIESLEHNITYISMQQKATWAQQGYMHM